VYSFICKFTNLKGKEGLQSPMECVGYVLLIARDGSLTLRRALSLEEALMSREPHPILTKVLVQFVLNLKPQARNIR
jgi:hypothetical protein